MLFRQLRRGYRGRPFRILNQGDLMMSTQLHLLIAVPMVLTVILTIGRALIRARKISKRRMSRLQERRKDMNVLKMVAALSLAALAIPAQGVYGGGPVDYIVTAQSPTALGLAVNHPNSTYGSNTFTLAPAVSNWTVGGTLTDYNAPLFSIGNDSVTISGLTVTRTGGLPFSVPTTTAGVGLATPPPYFGQLIGYQGSINYADGSVDNLTVAGTFQWSRTYLGGSDINSYNFVVLGNHVPAPGGGGGAAAAFGSSLEGSNESSPVFTAAFGSLAGLYDANTNRLSLELGMVGLQASDITGIQITSNAPGFTTLNLGTSALQNGPNGDGVALYADLSIPSSDLRAIAVGNSFVNVLTSENPGGEIGGTLSAMAVPEPSTCVLVATGLAIGFLRHGWRQRKKWRQNRSGRAGSIWVVAHPGSESV
jgi:hypothetical protein